MPDFQGYLFNDAGTAVNAASVAIFTRATAADETTASSLATATTTTSTAGLWTVSGVAEGTYDVRITSSGSVRWRRYQESVQYTTAEVATFRIRTPNASFVYTFVVGNIAANYNITIPTITANDTLAVLGLAQTYTTARTISVASAAALAVGPSGNTNPALRVVTNTTAAVTGVGITGAAVGARVAIAALSSGVNEGLDLDALGSGTVRLGGTSTGNIVLNRACNVQGAWVADAAWTVPAMTLGGTVTLNGQTLSGTAAGTPTFSGAVTMSATTAFTAASPFSLANGQTLTLSTTAQTVGAATLTIPNFAGVADTFAFITLAQTLSNKTLSAPTFSGAYSFGGTPTFGTTMAGASTFSGAITLSATAAFTAASPFSIANGQTLTVSTTAQTIGAATLTVPNFAGVADTFAFITLAQTLSNKTLSAPTFSGAYTLGGTPTFGATMAGASTFSGAITLSAASGNSLIVKTNVLVVDATNNRVGIGTTTPATDLHIRAVAPIGFIEASGAGDSQLQISNPSIGWSIINRGATDNRLVFRDSAERLILTTAGNMGFATTSFGGGAVVIGISNATTNPTANPTAGGIMYATAGAGTWRGSGGTITTFGAAGPHCSKCGYDFWRVACENEAWGASLRECGMCGTVYKRGPSSILHLLTQEQRQELVTL